MVIMKTFVAGTTMWAGACLLAAVENVSDANYGGAVKEVAFATMLVAAAIWFFRVEMPARRTRDDAVEARHRKEREEWVERMDTKEEQYQLSIAKITEQHAEATKTGHAAAAELKDAINRLRSSEDR